MKTILSSIIAFGSLSALACTGGICNGDKVIPDNYSNGYAIVKAINPSTQILTVQGNASSGLHKYSSSQVAVTSGCKSKICVGDTVIPDNYSNGYAIVQGINSNNNTFVVKGNSSASYHRYANGAMAISRGCLQNICVGDRVIPDNYTSGFAIVKAINFRTQTFTVLGNSSSSFHRYTADKLSY